MNRDVIAEDEEASFDYARGSKKETETEFPASLMRTSPCKETHGNHSSIKLRISSSKHLQIVDSLGTHTSCIMAFPSKFVTSYVQRCRVTHFLAIPLVTPNSRSQVLDSFKCLRDDLTANSVPIDAIRSPGLFHLNLEILLSLDTPKRMAKAKKILRKASIKETLRTIHGSSTSNNLFKHPSIALPTSIKDTNHSIAPLSVSISGLFCKPGMEVKTRNLSTISYDATHRVRNLKLGLAHAYQAAGLSPKSQRPRDPQARAAIGGILGSSGAMVRLVKTPYSSKVIPSKLKPGKFVRAPLPPFDARGLLERYKDHVWMENAPLDRISICRLGISKRGAEELPEVFSVPLS